MNETLVAKSITAAFATALIGFLKDKFLFDPDFLGIVILLIGVDTTLGLIVAWKTKKISSRKFERFFLKSACYLLLLGATHAVAIHAVNGHVNILFSWLDNVMYASICGRELLSILEKVQKIGIYTPPQWLISRLEMNNLEDKFVDKENKEHGND